MERKNTDLHDHDPGKAGPRELGGFSLIELLVGLAICSFLSLGLWTLMDSQDRTYRVQGNSADMQQSLRAAMDTLSRDLMLAGLGPDWPITGLDGSTTGGAGGWYLNDGSMPYRILANRIDIIGCTSPNEATLGTQANQAQTQITLSNAAQAAFFPVNTYVNIGGLECAKVTAKAGAVLTIDTDPGTAGTQPLYYTHAVSTDVRPLQWVTYVVEVVDNVSSLTRNLHDGNGARSVASSITGLAADDTLAAADKRMLIVTLTGSTPGANPVVRTATNTVFRRVDKIPEKS